MTQAVSRIQVCVSGHQDVAERGGTVRGSAHEAGGFRGVVLVEQPSRPLEAVDGFGIFRCSQLGGANPQARRLEPCQRTLGCVPILASITSACRRASAARVVSGR
jgi:hypothetical protein